MYMLVYPFSWEESFLSWGDFLVSDSPGGGAVCEDGCEDFVDGGLKGNRAPVGDLGGISVRFWNEDRGAHFPACWDTFMLQASVVDCSEELAFRIHFS